MLFYYYVFNLRHLAHWSLPPERAPPWYCMEQAVVAPLSPMQVLSTHLLEDMAGEGSGHIGGSVL